jgi:CRP-like cAMP-binding protein
MTSATTENYALRFKKHLQDNYRVSENEWNLLKDYHQCVTVKKNEYFVQKGKVCRMLAFIADGVMRYCMYREDGEEITCFFVSENEFAGDPESFTAQKPSDKNLHALTDCTLIGISPDHMQKMLKALPRFAEIMASIDRAVMMKLLGQRDLFYNMDAAAKYQKFIEYYPHILQRVPLSYVASFLGIKQQSLSRLRKQIS